MIGKIMDRKKLILILGILIVIIIIVIYIIMGNKELIISGFDNSDSVRFKDEYESLNDVESEDGKTYPKVKLPTNNLMKYSNTIEIINIFENNDDAVIYFGYSTCLYCRNAIQVLCDVAVDTELDVIYYLDIEDIDKESDEYKKLLNIMGKEFIVEDNDVIDLYIPLVAFVANGNIVSYNKGTLFSQGDPYIELDDSQVEGLSEIYRYGIRDVLDSIKSKNDNL